MVRDTMTRKNQIQRLEKKIEEVYEEKNKWTDKEDGEEFACDFPLNGHFVQFESKFTTKSTRKGSLAASDLPLLISPL